MTSGPSETSRRGPVHDVIVVGSGVAGLATALAAADDGASVLIVDAAERPGGTAAVAGGGICIAGSPVQRASGYVDDPALALEDWVSFGGPSVDVAWAERYLHAAVSEIWELLGSLGVRFTGVRWNEGNRVPRWHAPAGGGRAVMAAFEAAARARDRIRWANRTKVEHLVVEGGAVRGVHAVSGHGSARREHDLRARSVVLATGGFANDRSMVREHATAASGAPRILLGGGRGARGEGHRMLQAVRAATVNMDAVWMYPYGLPDERPDSLDRGLVVRGLVGEIWVNRAGHRFHDETRRGGASGTPALLAQDGATCWSIIDARIAERMTIADPAFRTGDVPDRAAIAALVQRSPWVTSADDVVSLGELAGIDARQLAVTVAEHNARCGTPGPDEFGRDTSELQPLIAPPFHALQFFPLARKNLGGVLTDAETRVVDVDGRTVSGLHAVGELAGMAGGRINGRAALEGTMFGPSLFSGLVAGRSLG